MDLLHHPAFQSFVLPVALALALVGVLRGLLGATRGGRWGPAAAGLALLIAMTQLPGFAWPVAATPQKLPWIVLAAWLLALLLEALNVQRWVQAGAAALLWLAASLWLAPAGGAFSLTALLLFVGGVAVLALLTLSVGAAPDSPAATNSGAAGIATLAVASLGLAGLVAGASLLLAQLAVMIAAAAAGLALWLWPRWRASFGAIAAMPLGLAWLGLAQCALQLTPLAPAQLAVLALAFVAAPLLARLRRPGARSLIAPLAAGLLAALPAAVAITWQATAPAPSDSQRPANADDPYYTPKWQ